MKIKFGLLIPLLLFSVAATTHANGLGGQRLEKVVGQYLVDVGTDQEFAPIAKTPILFDFNLLASDTRDIINYDIVHVRIAENENALLEKDLPMAPVGPTLLSYTFEKRGGYILQVMFSKKGKELAGAIFPLAIESLDTNSGMLTYFTSLFLGNLDIIGGVLALAVIAAIYFLSKKGVKKGKRE